MSAAKILVVDDEPAILEMLSRTLGDEVYKRIGKLVANLSLTEFTSQLGKPPLSQ